MLQISWFIAIWLNVKTDLCETCKMDLPTVPNNKKIHIIIDIYISMADSCMLEEQPKLNVGPYFLMFAFKVGV